MSVEKLETTQEDSAQNDASARDEAVAALDKMLSGDVTPEAALAEAGVTEKKPEAKKPAESLKEKLAEPAKEEGEEKTEEENRIAVVMRARRQAQKIRESAETAAQEQLRQVQEQVRQLEERQRSAVSKLREKPIDALKELGLDPREFFERAVEDPKRLDPMEMLRQELVSIKTELADRDKREREREEQARKQHEESQRSGAQQAAVNQFLSDALSEKYTYLNAFYKNSPHDLAQKAIAVVKEYNAKGGDSSELTNEEIAQYLEEQERNRYMQLKELLEQEGSKPARAATGSASITQKDVSQKRTRSKKTVDEMSDEERRSEAIAALGAG